MLASADDRLPLGNDGALTLPQLLATPSTARCDDATRRLFATLRALAANQTVLRDDAAADVADDAVDNHNY